MNQQIDNVKELPTALALHAARRPTSKVMFNSAASNLGGSSVQKVKGTGITIRQEVPLAQSGSAWEQNTRQEGAHRTNNYAGYGGYGQLSGSARASRPERSFEGYGAIGDTKPEGSFGGYSATMSSGLGVDNFDDRDHPKLSNRQHNPYQYDHFQYPAYNNDQYDPSQYPAYNDDRLPPYNDDPNNFKSLYPELDSFLNSPHGVPQPENPALVARPPAQLASFQYPLMGPTLMAQAAGNNAPVATYQNGFAGYVNTPNAGNPSLIVSAPTVLRIANNFGQANQVGTANQNGNLCQNGNTSQNGNANQNGQAIHGQAITNGPPTPRAYATKVTTAFLRAMAVVRGLPVRLSWKNAIDGTKRNGLERGKLIATKGHQALRPCARCRAGQGPIEGCYIVQTATGVTVKCANCSYLGRKCSLT